MKKLIYYMSVLLIVCCNSCANMSKEDQIKISGVSYTSIGTMLQNVGESVTLLYKEGKLKPEKFDEIAKVYNSILPLYKNAGDIQLDILRLDLSGTNYTDKQEQFDSLMGEVKTLLSQLLLTLKDFGIEFTF